MVARKFPAVPDPRLTNKFKIFDFNIALCVPEIQAIESMFRNSKSVALIIIKSQIPGVF